MSQQGTNFVMAVRLKVKGQASTVNPLEGVSSIEFLFKQTRDKSATAIKTALWKPDGSGSAVTAEDGKTILIPWTRTDTYKFLEGTWFYLHARIHYTDSADDNNPEVKIKELRMDHTLFKSGEEVTS